VTQLTIPNPQDLQGQVLFDVSGEGIGVIEGVYLDSVSRSPEWAAVRLGPEALALVPLVQASFSSGAVRVGYERETVLGAPSKLTALDNEVTEDTEQRLYAYYEGGGNGAAPAVVEEAEQVLDAAREEAFEVAGVAREEAFEVAGAAKEQAADVVDLAREETTDVAQVAAAEARDMVETTRSELELQAELQIAQFAESLHRLAGQSLALARGNPEQAGPLGDLVRRAGEEIQEVATGIEERGSSGLLTDAQRVVRQRPRAAIIGTAVAVVAGARLMGTPAGERLKERLAPLRDQAIEAGRNVADELKPIAQHRAEQMKSVVTSAADQVRADAQGTAADVKGTAKRSTRTVKRTAKESATAVKGTARQSSSTATASTKRAARAG
jgi:cell division septum initiation protein DivIVA